MSRASGYGVLKSLFTPRVVDLTLSLDTSAYADGDVLAATQEVASVTRENGGPALLESINLLDEDDNGTALDLVFFDANVALGTENSAPNISDANARNILGIVSIATGDYVDLGGARVALKRDLGLILKAASGSRSIYVAAITRGGTPTYTASGIKIRFGFL